MVKIKKPEVTETLISKEFDTEVVEHTTFNAPPFGEGMEIEFGLENLTPTAQFANIKIIMHVKISCDPNPESANAAMDWLVNFVDERANRVQEKINEALKA